MTSPAPERPAAMRPPCEHDGHQGGDDLGSHDAVAVARNLRLGMQGSKAQQIEDAKIDDDARHSHSKEAAELPATRIERECHG